MRFYSLFIRFFFVSRYFVVPFILSSYHFSTKIICKRLKKKVATWPSATSNIGTMTSSGGGFGMNQSGFGSGGILANTGNTTTNNALSLFGGSNTLNINSGFGSDGTFNLQKPPVGTKRNKQ